MVTAAARTLARRRIGACETTPHATHRDRHATPDKPKPQPKPLPRPAMIFRRLPASSSFVLAAARLRALQHDSWPRDGKTRAAARKDPEEQSAQPGGARSHRARSVRPLDTGGPYGCRIECVSAAHCYVQYGMLAHGSANLAVPR